MRKILPFEKKFAGKARLALLVLAVSLGLGLVWALPPQVNRFENVDTEAANFLKYLQKHIDNSAHEETAKKFVFGYQVESIVPPVTISSRQFIFNMKPRSGTCCFWKWNGESWECDADCH